MHRAEYIKLIDEAAADLGIETTHFSGNWAIQLNKDGITKYIVGYTLPLNDSACYKIARNKNLCSEILSLNNIANVPHQLIFSPSILEKRKTAKGNFEIIQQYIADKSFPFLIKKNNSSGGEGVFFIHNEPEMESVLAKVYSTDATLCLSPYRENIREYRNIILNDKCLLSYEKKIPFITGDGQSSVIELLSEFQKKNISNSSKPEKLFDESLVKKFSEIPKLNEKVILQWKHNTSLGTTCEIVDNEEMKMMAIKAAQSINAKFASVDIIYSEKFGLEVLEINASVVMLLFTTASKVNYNKTIEIFKLALKEVFALK